MHDADRQLASYNYELPPEQIAQVPLTPRDSSRLLVLPSPTERVHAHFHTLPDWLQANDLLVLNDTRVLPARLYGRKSTGTMVEVLLLEQQGPEKWLALVKPGRRLPTGSAIAFNPPDAGLQATVVDRDESTGGRVLHFTVPDGRSFEEVLAQCGRVPLPPYVKSTAARPEQYQTVYAQRVGAIAAPTAGLHFTEDLLQRLGARGIQQARVTLHVGLGTFRPVETDDITAHAMHSEWLEVPAATVEQIERARSNGGRIIAVGTTVVRALEGAAAEGGQLVPFSGKTNLFIFPGYQPRVVDGLITNFHLPKSSLLMLVSAFIGRPRLLSLYEEAIAQGYRFYSFGDAMAILPAATLQESTPHDVVD
ncbi:S-adenosylmethionine:tRNA ribosyltransferase-isomerase [Rubidibacter lacunae KORDI 51-2]|uniref:S-adenosylmethionine:tRNA ribosyltransferase-isomerase n=1 Tax=Rubidibacter lacunae KORDI 51-2 TaxID=582515 RepID=U5DE05_9CHRO|nr:tRNA preQ1(34) S-adenosylmethionine ribosyltransferase-isomerase QueA [Rubidibacter lacunae]ERN39856.1 S-adenosylmethionine:tRNA ribosyltransferase-isomerase [Rubidibacter lacunae KORDI 51-2]